jgi:hypothetical protein
MECCGLLRLFLRLLQAVWKEKVDVTAQKKMSPDDFISWQ